PTPPRHLQHPFPTRRSSDLASNQTQLEHDPCRRADFESSEEQARRSNSLTLSAHNPFQLTITDNRNTCPVPLTVHPQAFFSHPLDRKSTRLNSSHVAISYAV